MRNLDQLITWEQNFGLLPIHLSNAQGDEANYILLNGGRGDLCIDLNANNDNEDNYFSKSWSSSTHNYIALKDDMVNIYHWKKRTQEKIKKEDVENNLSKFYKYLMQSSNRSERDIVPTVIDVFKQFRNFTQEASDGTEALNLLFALLAGLEDDPYTLDSVKWGLSNVAIPSNFEYYTDRLTNQDLSPDLKLILRHSAGVLFQEAQKEVLFFDKNINLFGGYSSDIDTKKKLYTSVHYTPSYLSRAIVEQVVRKIDINKPVLKILDPACGSSEFFIELLKQLAEKDFQGKIEITGWDISQSAINTSIFLLTYEKRTVWENQLSFNIKRVNDSLMETWENNFDVILMNPPFISWEHLSKDMRDVVKSSLGFSKLGRPNQASAFYFKAIQSLNENGVIGCVIPTSLLTLDTYKELRNTSNELIEFDLVGKLGNFVFEDALTDVSILIGHKPKSDAVPYVLWIKNERNSVSDALRDLRKMHSLNKYTVNTANHSIYQPNSFPIARENWKPISYSEYELFKELTRHSLENKLVDIQTIFNVNQGVRTGNNEAFIISLEDYYRLPEEEQEYFRPSVDNSSINNGRIKKNNYLWYPYSSKGIMIQSEEQLKNCVPQYYEMKLSKHRNALIGRARKDESNWWHLSEYRAWLKEKKMRLVSAEFGNKDSFAIDITGEYVIERGNGWSPKNEFTEDDFYFYLSLFSSTFFEKLLSIYSKQLAGGKWYDLGKKYTKDIPIPNIHSLEVKESIGYEKLVSLGRDKAEGFTHSSIFIDKVLTKYFY